MLTRAALPALALAACSGAAGNEKGPATGGTETRPANVSQAATVSPLTGLWHQTGATCASGAAESVEELEFEAGGRFLVTFVPFETYHDYWGPYRFDAATGALAMTVERGNSIPTDLDLQGRATLAANGELAIEGVNFGTPHGATAKARTCTLRFTRRR